MARWLMVLVLVGCGGKAAEGESCASDNECETNYCECASACRDGCCAKKPQIAYDACTDDCQDLACPAD